MVNLFLMMLVMSYVFFFHQGVLNALGLSQRDNQLMWIGFGSCLIYQEFSKFVIGLWNGGLLLTPLVMMALFSLLIRMNYKRL